jgi:hypothetical protein
MDDLDTLGNGRAAIFARRSAGDQKPVGRDVMNICHSAALLSLPSGRLEQQHVEEAIARMLTHSQHLGGGVMATNIGASFTTGAQKGRDQGAVVLIGGDSPRPKEENNE